MEINRYLIFYEACKVPLSMEFSGREYRSGLPFSSPGDDLPELAADLRKLGVKTCYRTLPASGGNVFLEPDLFDRSAIILGCEATGVAELENSRGLNIPMPGDAESLNVAQAATVILFEYVRRMF